MASDLPFHAKAEARIEFTKSEQKLEYDYKNFPFCTNKIEPVGKLKPRKYLIKCDGHHMGFDELRSPLQIIEELGKLRDKGYITQEEFERKKRELLERI